MTPARPDLPLRCPACASALAPPGPGGITCGACERQFPAVAGVLDLRMEVEGFDLEADRRLAERLGDRQDLDLEGLLSELWRNRPDVPPTLAERFMRTDLIGEARAADVAEQIEDMLGTAVFDGATVLEVGAGTAALAAAVRHRVSRLVVTDISLAWLVVARRRLQDTSGATTLVVACAGESLPFADQTFDLVLGADVIEHVPDADALATSCHRVMRPGAHLWLSTPNRLSLTPEPHVRLWGVGFLPRRLAEAYVRRCRGVDYREIHTLTAPQLRHLLAATGGRVQLVAPAIPRPLRQGYHPVMRALIDVYNRLSRTPGVRRGLVAVAPLFHAVLTRTGTMA